MDIKDIDNLNNPPEPDNFSGIIAKTQKFLSISDNQEKVYSFTKDSVPYGRLDVKKQENGDIVVRRTTKVRFSEELDSEVQDRVVFSGQKIKSVSTSVTPIKNGVKSNNVDTYTYDENGYRNQTAGEETMSASGNLRTQVTSQVNSVFKDLENFIDKEQ